MKNLIDKKMRRNKEIKRGHRGSFRSQGNHV